MNGLESAVKRAKKVQDLAKKAEKSDSTVDPNYYPNGWRSN